MPCSCEALSPKRVAEPTSNMFFTVMIHQAEQRKLLRKPSDSILLTNPPSNLKLTAKACNEVILVVGTSDANKPEHGLLAVI